MARERIIDGQALGLDEQRYDLALRPESLDECIGQAKLIEKIRIAVAAARQRAEPVEHILLHGPPGLGKTTIAHVIAHEMDATIKTSAGPALVRSGDLMGILTNLQGGDVLFIDEIHRLPAVVEEFIYPAMEDFKVDFTVDSGMHAKTINIPLQPFTLIGATTRTGLISAPLRARFGIQHHLEFWSVEDLTRCLIRSAGLLNTHADEAVLRHIAQCSRGTPRVANRLLRRARDYAQVHGDGTLLAELAGAALRIEEIDELGLDRLDRSLLESLIKTYNGGPAGIEALAATLGEERDTLEDVVEPYLLQIGFIARTRSGRVATPAAYAHLNLQPPQQQPSDATVEDPTLFE